ncbi:MAG: hypothetical protein RLZ35_973 [Pseudomonadota bacterium]|jgi:ribosome-associated toxin RatA of RatAB toxin-antitoxin module
MPIVQKNAVVPYSAEQMYALVNDVGTYPSFLPWCVAATIREKSDQQMIATLTIAKGPFRETFTTKNTLIPNRHIHLSLVDGPFTQLEGDWHFMPEGPGKGSRVSLDLAFTFGSGFTARLISPLFESIASRFVEAFCDQAKQQYGEYRAI